MIYILLKSQDVSKLNTKGNIPVEFQKSKRNDKMLSQTSQCFLSLKNDLKAREPLEFHLSLLAAYKLICASVLSVVYFLF